MAAGKQKTSVAPHPPSPVASTPETHDKKNKKKKRATTPKTRQDDTDALSPSDTLDFGTLPAPDEGLAEAIAAVLEAPRAAVNGGGKSNNLGVAGADATAAAQAELLATANELYQRMDAGGGGLRPDGAYWAALPAHIRNFVRTASLSPPLHTAGGNERAKAQAMYSIAQQMVQTGEQGEGQDQGHAAARNDVDGASERDMATATAAGRLVAGWQGEMTLPVDPSFFADAAFAAALEEQGEKGGVIEVGVVAEVTSGEGGEEEEHSYLTSEEAEVEGERWPVAGERGRNRGRNRRGSGKRTGTVAGAAADEEGRDREEDEEIPTPDRKLLTGSVVSDLLPKTEAPAAATPAAARAAVPKAKSSANNMPSQTRQPSSRAQGKQPMNYAPPPTSTTTTATTTTTTTTATTATTTTTTAVQQKTNTPSPTTRSSSKAAAKAPLAHPYPHTHPHHHPSPPSSNASQSQKHRPPSAQVPRNNPSINNKIWSTSSTEERERIKEFWLALGEEERRNLVKVEKEAVLKKMKEQQRHSCACAVCGRKRSVHRLCLLFFPLPSLMSMRPFSRAILLHQERHRRRTRGTVRCLLR